MNLSPLYIKEISLKNIFSPEEFVQYIIHNIYTALIYDNTLIKESKDNPVIILLEPLNENFQNTKVGVNFHFSLNIGYIPYEIIKNMYFICNNNSYLGIVIYKINKNYFVI